ncbi:very short patch repair endonuclease [Arthrobacter sp. AQ5-05]|nr:very short patch repair endonuclease [Arthrobacter sp. AQ5-05]RAX49564.1 very short patch repair endonuclease [Arthrobacter sp. AQ5-05]
MDSMSEQARSQLMGRIRGKDTKPEFFVRKLLHAAGYRYWLHGRIPRRTLETLKRENPAALLRGGKLPGTPDIVFASRRKAVFINGCFWHLHDCPAGQHAPATNRQFWADKRNRTRERDQENAAALHALGWKTIVLWECELRDPKAVLAVLVDFLGPPSAVERATGSKGA